ncbi:AP2 domain-containing protein [Variovorax sp. PAMC26660]|uniref:AP2 domain-containing protein n=1 Tax=Variovorax sp. PAMC26660 TaxID=2762322 RepID=UPI00164DD89F|nr:AP2 domain-containing protein [Variovorax sp. PAMC26660]QNK67630.1 AP2 domain-containing protein [Variovorax sp. PAMC26660]
MPKGIPNPPSMRGIWRMEDRWEVSIIRQGQRHRRVFLFSTHSGVRASLKVAKQWRDEVEAKKPLTPRYVQASKPRVDSPSGIAGVTCIRWAPDGAPSVWRAQTRVDGRNLNRSFSIGRYGERAQDLAIEAREKQLEQMKQWLLSRNA